MQVLEACLNEFDCVFVRDLPEEKNNEVQDLFHLNCIEFCLICLLLQGCDHWWEAKVGKGLHALEQVLILEFAHRAGRYPARHSG